MSPINLRPYQQDFIDAVRNEFLRGNRRVVGVAPCGAGKTIMTGWMIRESLNRGKRSIFFVHRKELIDQTAATFKQLGIPHGIISADVPMQLELPVQIASVQTLARRPPTNCSIGFSIRTARWRRKLLTRRETCYNNQNIERLIRYDEG